MKRVDGGQGSPENSRERAKYLPPLCEIYGPQHAGKLYRRAVTHTMGSNKIEITNTKAKFFAGPRDSPIPIDVLEVHGGPTGASAFIYRCPLNLDLDGAPTTYGLDNPGGENSAKDKTLQINLKPLESRPNQISGLGNACGDPDDKSQTKGFNNFLFAHDRNFYWAGLTAVTKAEGAARGLVYDTRAFLEAGRKGAKSPIAPKGERVFPRDSVER